MGFTNEMIEKARKTKGELSEKELENVSGGGCGGGGNRGAHVRLPGGVCPFCGASDPSGYYGYSYSHHGSTQWYMENLDCCHNRMNLSQNQAQQLVEIS